MQAQRVLSLLRGKYGISRTKEAFKLYLKIHISCSVILGFCCSGEMLHHATECMGTNQAVAQCHTPQA
jgi:hypothetical protein